MFWFYSTFLKIHGVVLRTTHPMVGMFLLIGKHFSCWVQILVRFWCGKFVKKVWKNWTLISVVQNWLNVFCNEFDTYYVWVCLGCLYIGLVCGLSWELCSIDETFLKNFTHNWMHLIIICLWNYQKQAVVYWIVMKKDFGKKCDIARFT